MKYLSVLLFVFLSVQLSVRAWFVEVLIAIWYSPGDRIFEYTSSEPVERSNDSSNTARSLEPRPDFSTIIFIPTLLFVLLVIIISSRSDVFSVQPAGITVPVRIVYLQKDLRLSGVMIVVMSGLNVPIIHVIADVGLDAGIILPGVG